MTDGFKNHGFYLDRIFRPPGIVGFCPRCRADRASGAPTSRLLDPALGDLDVDLLRVSRELGFLCQGGLLVCLQPGLGFFAFPYLFVANCGLRRDAQRFGGVHHGASAGKSRELRGQLTGRRFFLTGSSALLYFVGFVAFGKLTGSSPVLTGSSFFSHGKFVGQQRALPVFRSACTRWTGDAGDCRSGGCSRRLYFVDTASPVR